MGITGLLGFIKRQGVLRPERLCNCRVVADGHNLCYFIYEASDALWQYGGDYDRFAQEIREVMENLAACKVQVFVLMDGADPPNDSKLATMLQRSQERLWRIERQKGSVLPRLALVTFQAVLKDMGVPFVVCDFEADRVAAALAAHWHCPVLSNDSDFCVYDLSGGVIFLEKANGFQPTRDASGQPSLPVRVYHVERFVRSIGLTMDTLYLFATLMGHDDVRCKEFHRFLYSLPSPGIRGVSARHVLFTKVLLWLNTVGDLDHAIEDMKEKYTDGDLLHSDWYRVESLISMSMSQFRDFKQENVCYVLNHFARYVTSDPVVENEAIQEGEGARLQVSAESERQGESPWYIEALRKGDLRSAIMTCMQDRRVIHNCQVEDLKSPSVNETSLSIRHTLYNVLNCPTIEEYDRCKKKEVSPPRKDLHVPTLLEVESWSQTEKLGVVAIALGVTMDFVQKLPEELRFLVAVAVYWINHAKPRVTLLMCFILLHARRELWTRREAAVSPQPERSRSENTSHSEESGQEIPENESRQPRSDFEETRQLALDSRETELTPKSEESGTLTSNSKGSRPLTPKSKEFTSLGPDSKESEQTSLGTEEPRQTKQDSEETTQSFTDPTETRHDAPDSETARQVRLECSEQGQMNSHSQEPSRVGPNSEESRQVTLHCEESVLVDPDSDTSRPENSDRKDDKYIERSLDEPSKEPSCQQPDFGECTPVTGALEEDALTRHTELENRRTHACSDDAKDDAKTTSDLRSPPHTDVKPAEILPVDAMCRALTISDLERIVQKLQRFHLPPKIRGGPQVDVTVVHAFSQLQACLLHAMWLSSALQWPLPPPRLWQLFNATFLCNFYEALVHSKHPEDFIQRLLGTSAAMDMLSSLRKVIQGQLSEVGHSTGDSTPSPEKQSKKAKGKKAKSARPKGR